MKLRKILAIILVFAITMSLGPAAFADALIADAYLSGKKPLRINADNTINIADGSLIEGRLINDDYTLSEVTTDDVDKVVYEIGLAIIDGDEKAVADLEQELDNMGVKDSTPEELQVISGASTQAARASSSTVSYKTSTYSVTVNGKSYQVKEVIALPTTESNLFHSVSVNKKKISSSVASGEYELLKAIGSAVTGAVYAEYGKYISAFSALKSVISGLNSTTKVYGITATYVCAALEMVRFYSYKTSYGWQGYASSSYAQTAISATIFSTSYAGGSKSGLNMAVSAVKDLVCSSNGYGAANLLKQYFQTYLYNKNSQITNVIFYHNAKGTRKTIDVIGMTCPTTTADIH